MTADQLAAYARRQIAAADQILSEHAALGGGMCRCGRSWPCPVAASCEQRRGHYAMKLELVEATLLLPVIRRRGSPRRAFVRWIASLVAGRAS